MKSKQEKTNINRRNILKRGYVAAATIAMSGVVTARAHAKPQEDCGPITKDKTKELSYLPIPKQVPVTEGVLSLAGGAGLYYWDTGGTGPTIVLSHPGRGSALTWPYQQPVLAASGFRVVAYSRRGHYGSPTGSDKDTGNYADDLNALMTHLDVDKFHILGLAAGGFTVCDYAVSYPDKLLSIVIACSLFGLWDKNIDQRSDFILSKGFESLPPEFKELSPAYRWAHPEGVRKWVEMEEKSIGKGPRVYQGAKSKITWKKMRALKLPTFFITGGADLYQPPSMMRAAARQLPGCETLIVPEAGHAVQWEQPDLFNRMVVEFFKRHNQSRNDFTS